MNSKAVQVLLSTALTLTAALFAHQAQATPLTFSTSGTIGSGYDDSGTFFGGVPNVNLSGLNFTLVTTIDPTSQPGPQTDNSTFNYEIGNNAIPFSETVTINGVTKTFSGVTSFSDTELDIRGQVVPNSGNNYAYQYQNGLTADETYLSGYQYVYGPGNFGLGLSFNQVWSYTPQSSDGQNTQFSLLGTDGDVYFEVNPYAGNVTNISINESNSTVPEPSSIALVGAALLGSVAVRRRHNQ